MLALLIQKAKKNSQWRIKLWVFWHTSADVLQVDEAASAAEEVVIEKDKNYHIFSNRLNMTLRI